MRGGTLRHLITIQQVSEVRSATGSPVETWSAFDQVWASVEPLSGREYLSAEQIQSEVTHKIKIRYLAGVTTKMRVLHDGRTFDIESTINDRERNRMITMMAVERST